MQQYKHWHTEVITHKQRQYLALVLDRCDSNVNSINREVLLELQQLLQYVKQANIAGLSITSGKARGFIAGADVYEFSVELIELGQTVLAELAALSCPTVAIINGFCLGGGLELALACRYRIGVMSEDLKLGFPEIHLGIHPGWGGTVYACKLIGAHRALPLMLQGNSLHGVAAYRSGLLDMLVNVNDVGVARDQCWLQAKVRHAVWWHGIWHFTGVRKLFAWYVSKQIRRKINETHYPAPFQLLRYWVAAYGKSTALQQEAASVTALAATDTAKNLLRIFKLREQLKKASKTATKIRHVHVIGGGVMGGDIAAWCALKGLHVTLEDVNLTAVSMALSRAKSLFQRMLGSKHLVVAACDRLVVDHAKIGRGLADIIIEAIVEDPGVKQALFTELAAVVKPGALLATNTSTLTLEALQKQKAMPQLVGIHFFNPVAKMPLVEIILPATKNEICSESELLGFMHKLEKIPVLVRDCPGFLVNRLLLPYLIESLLLLAEGQAAVDLDASMRAFGMPMGPIELMDTIGLDVCAHAAQGLGLAVPENLQAKIQQKHLGKKTQIGFYRYQSNGKKIVKTKVSQDPALLKEIQLRLLLRLLNASVAALRERVVADEDTLDISMILGSGFAPHTGGPMHYLHTVGVEVLRAELTRLAERYGERFVADSGWESL
jgi:3-hydroxyacyl-CoA dehydrogenase/enoyl-CoA hydratase/3-hydroxybutyryl-CoA epimerase